MKKQYLNKYNAIKKLRDDILQDANVDLYGNAALSDREKQFLKDYNMELEQLDKILKEL